MEDLANFVRASIRPIGVIIILAASVQMMVEGRTPPGWFIPFIVFAAEWFVERPVLHIKEKK